MQKQKEDTSANLSKLQKKKKIKNIKIILSIVIVLVLLIIVIISFSAYFYFKSPEKTLGIGANIESALLNEQGNLVYIKLLGGSDKNITKIKFIFTDFLGSEHYYETTEGIKEIEVPLKRGFVMR